MKNRKQKLFNGFCIVFFGAPLKACQGPHKLSFGAHKLYFRTFKGPLGTKMGPFRAWTLLKLYKYYSKILKRVQRALIGLQKDYFGPKNTGKCLGFAIEKKFLLYRASWGPPGPPLACGAPRKILGCHPLSTALASAQFTFALACPQTLKVSWKPVVISDTLAPL